MGVYVVMWPDEDIRRKASRFKSLVILGCAVCANISLAYDKNLPVSRVLVDKETGHTKKLPVAVVEEVNRLKSFLKSKGIDARVEALSSLCRFSDESGPDDLNLAKLCTDAEAVVILACQAGIVGVKRRLGGTVKILPGMRTVGLCQSYTFTDHEKGLVHIDKSRSTLIRLFKQ